MSSTGPHTALTVTPAAPLVRHPIDARGHAFEAGSVSSMLGVVTAARTKVACGLAALFVTAISCWARLEVPVPVGLSTYDDILFLRGATSIASGDWLGPFDQVTLAKGAAYPAFIAAMHVLGIPVKIGEQATYALACATVAASLAVVTRRVALATAAYVVLALNPVNFGWGALNSFEIAGTPR